MEAADPSEMPETAYQGAWCFPRTAVRILSAVMPTNPIKCLSVLKPTLLCYFLINLYLCVCFLFSDEGSGIRTHTYLRTYHFVGPQILSLQQSDMKLVR